MDLVRVWFGGFSSSTPSLNCLPFFWDRSAYMLVGVVNKMNVGEVEQNRKAEVCA